MRTRLVVEFNGAVSSTLVSVLQDSSPELFTVDGSGSGAVAALNADYSMNDAANPAAAGSYLVLYGGGLTVGVSPNGSINPIVPEPDGTSDVVSVTIGGQNAPVLFAGAAPGLVYGVDQINVTVPAGLAPGQQAITIATATPGTQQTLRVYVK